MDILCRVSVLRKRILLKINLKAWSSSQSFKRTDAAFLHWWITNALSMAEHLLRINYSLNDRGSNVFRILIFSLSRFVRVPHIGINWSFWRSRWDSPFDVQWTLFIWNESFQMDHLLLDFSRVASRDGNRDSVTEYRFAASHQTLWSFLMKSLNFNVSFSFLIRYRWTAIILVDCEIVRLFRLARLSCCLSSL